MAFATLTRGPKSLMSCMVFTFRVDDLCVFKNKSNNDKLKT